MFQFIVTNVLMVSLGTILYLTVRTLPRIEDAGVPEKRGLLERWLTSEAPEKIDAVLNGFILKFLRRARVAVLKLDNSLTGQLKKIQLENGNGKGKPQIDFKTISEEKAVENGTQLGDNQTRES